MNSGLMYKIKFTKTAAKNFKKLDKRYQSAVSKAIDRLRINPKLGDGLTGSLKGFRRLRFSRYRIIYSIKASQLIVIIVDVKHRREVYK